MTPVGPALPVQTRAVTSPSLDTAARQFEAIFVRQMLAAARQSSHGDPMFDSEASSTFRQMLDDRFADIASERGVFGLAGVISEALAPAIGASPTAKAP